MIRIRFKAMAGKYTILKPFFIFGYPLLMITLYLMRDLMRDFRSNYIAVGIPFMVSMGIFRVALYYLFSSYYKFSYAENILIIKKQDKLWKNIPIQDIKKIVYGYNFEYYASNVVIHTNQEELFLVASGLTTSKEDSIKVRHLITQRLKPILLENDFQEKITEKEKKIIFEYVKNN